MARTFRTLAVMRALALFLTIALGFYSFLTPGESKYKDIFIYHFVFGLFTAIGILLVHCLIFIYFLGTGRWVKEVTIAYRMPDEPWHKRTRELKRASVSAGAVLDAVRHRRRRRRGRSPVASVAVVRPHDAGPATLLVNLWAFRIELRNVDAECRHHRRGDGRGGPHACRPGAPHQ